MPTPNDFASYQIALQQAQRQSKLAEALRQQSFQPIESADQGSVLKAPISHLQGLAKMLQAYAANKGEQRSIENMGKAYGMQGNMIAGMFGGSGGGGYQTTTGAPSQTAQNPVQPQVSPEQYTKAITDSAMTGEPSANLPPVTQPQVQNMQPSGQSGLRIPAGQTPQSMASMMQMNPQLAASLTEAYNKPSETSLMAMEAGNRPGSSGYQAALSQKLNPPVVNRGFGLNVYNPKTGAYEPDPGSMRGIAEASQLAAAGTASGKAPYELSTVNTGPAPRLMTHQQQIEAATGRPMPIPGSKIGSPQGLPIPQMPQNLQSPTGRAQDTGIPGGNVRALSGPGLTLQDQGQAEEQKKTGAMMGDYTGGVMQDAAKSAVANRSLDNMVMAAQDFAPGKLAPMQNSLIQWAQAAGLPVSEESKKQAGSIQALTSMAIKMAGTATRQADAQPSQLQYFKILESMPNESRTIDGFNKITAYLRDMNNYNVEKWKHLQDWRNTHQGSAEKFEAAWPKMSEQVPFVWNTQGLGKDKSQVKSKIIHWNDLP